jgi:hypothetical protein
VLTFVWDGFNASLALYTLFFFSLTGVLMNQDVAPLLDQLPNRCLDRTESSERMLSERLAFSQPVLRFPAWRAWKPVAIGASNCGVVRFTWDKNRNQTH